MAKWIRKVFSAQVVRTLCGVFTLVAVVQYSESARAALGDDVSAVEQDRVQMHANLQVRRNANYDVHELATAIGSTVREFVGQDGKVFAVSWSGGWRPDLRTIMGSHYARYIEHTRGKRRARGPARIELPGMVVFMGTYLRTSFGHVYLTDQLPTGFSPEEIK
jgi:hypothetical protein